MKRQNLTRCARLVWRALPFALVLLVLVCAFALRPAPARAEGEQLVVRVWNVDTFEGGKGSRTAFLKRAAALAQAQQKGVFYLVTSCTVEGARAALQAGEQPDMLSFGVGLGDFLEKSLPLDGTFSGGEAGGKQFALPWCRGGYFLFSREEDFSGAGKTVLSAGGCNLVEVAARLAGIEGELLPSLNAYTAFVRGEYRYLFGTQRDACRLEARGEAYFKRALPQYNDLYQVCSILSEGKRAACERLLYVLRGAEMQGELSSIGMFPVAEDESERTVSVFSDDDALARVRALATQPSQTKNLVKILKII